MSKKYPKTLFVQSQDAGVNEFLQAERDFKKIPDDGVVAVYELKEVRNRKTEIRLN